MTARAYPQDEARTEPPEAEPPVSRRRILAALAIPPVAWAVHEMACAAVAGWFCLHGRPTVVRVTTIVLTLVGLALTASSTFVSLGSFRKLSTSSANPFEAEADAWREMLAMAGVLLGVVFSLGLVWGGLSSVLFDASLCEVAR